MPPLLISEYCRLGKQRYVTVAVYIVPRVAFRYLRAALVLFDRTSIPIFEYYSIDVDACCAHTRLLVDCRMVGFW